MAELFASGRIVDAIVAFMIVEYALLKILQRTLHRGLSTAELVANFASGAALLMSLRAALTGAAWQLIAIWLLASLLAHLVDIRMRWTLKPEF